jgi:hypothetical protein
MPEKAAEHITSILDAHARFCGLPGAKNLCNRYDVLARLVWVAAGVPRDAINIFSQAMTKASLLDRRLVAIADVNTAASEALPGKLKDLEVDAASEARELHSLLDRIGNFCVREKKRNAFLFKIGESRTFQRILKLVDARLLHVISEGITIRRAGERYLGLVLDYGFYTGLRAAKSVELFNRQAIKVAYKDLRKLPVLKDFRENA